MGNSLFLIKDGKKVIELCKANNFRNVTKDFNDIDYRITNDIVAQCGYTPKDYEELLTMINDTIQAIEELKEECVMYGKYSLIEDLKNEGGFETMDDYEWEEREKIKAMPDYFEPKI